VPHFDVHFVMEPIENIFAITAGPCGPEFVRCDQFETAKKPVLPNHVAADFRDVDAVVPAMGNHLIDLTGPEFQEQPFTHSWIHGVYSGRIIFKEVMLPRALLLSKPDTGVPIFDTHSPDRSASRCGPDSGDPVRRARRSGLRCHPSEIRCALMNNPG